MSGDYDPRLKMIPTALQKAISYALDQPELEVKVHSPSHWQVVWRDPKKVIMDFWPTTGGYRRGDAAPKSPGLYGTSEDMFTALKSAFLDVRRKVQMEQLASHVTPPKEPAHDEFDDLDVAAFMPEFVYLVALHALIIRATEFDPDELARKALSVLRASSRVIAST